MAWTPIVASDVESYPVFSLDDLLGFASTGQIAAYVATTEVACVYITSKLSTERFVYLNDFDNADLYFNKAIQFAETNNMPAAQVNIMKDMIADVKENYSRQWKETGPLNKVRLPLAPSMGPKACAFCHTGASFPDSYYKE